MTKIDTPDSRPEDLAELGDQIKDLASFLNTNPDAKRLLADAQAGRLTEQELLAALLKLSVSASPPDTAES